MPNAKFNPSVVLKIEEILLALTDGTFDESTGTAKPIRTLTITEIKTELLRRYGIDQSDDKIRNILRSQSDATCSKTPTKIGELSWASLWWVIAEGCEKKQSFFVVRKLSKRQITYLAQLLRSTSSGGKAPGTFYTLSNMLSETDRDKFEEEIDAALSKATPSEIYFANTLKMIESIQTAIDSCKPIKYRYIANTPEGTCRESLPLRIEISEGYPYLVEKEEMYMSLIRIEMMQDIEIGEASDISYSPKNDKELKSLQEEAYALVHGMVNRMTGNNALIHARCHDDHKLKYVRDIFGNKEGFRELPMGTENRRDFEFVASTVGMKPQAIKWMEWFEVIEPISLRNEIIEAIERNTYGRFKEAS